MFGHIDVLKQMFNFEKKIEINKNVGKKIIDCCLLLIKESFRREKWKETILVLFLHQHVWKIPVFD